MNIKNMIALAVWGLIAASGLAAPGAARAQAVSPTKAAPQVVLPVPQASYVSPAPQSFVPATVPSTSLAPTPALAPTPTLLTTAPAPVAYPMLASPQGYASPQASPQSGGPSCACYYPQGRCPFPSGNCAFPQGNCVAPAGSCVGGPCYGVPQGTPQVSPQALEPIASARTATAK